MTNVISQTQPSGFLDESCLKQGAIREVVLQVNDDSIAIGRGPFEQRTNPPASGFAFYYNDFALTDPAPWWVPQTWEVQAFDPNSSQTKPAALNFAWDPPNKELFLRHWAEIQSAFQAGSLRKIVPVVTETGRASIDPTEWFCRARRSLNGRFFCVVQEGGGVVGITPERLMRIDGSELRTMALAGTATADAGERLLTDPKEHVEHSAVVDFLAESLSEFGEVTMGEKALRPVGRLVHLMTPIELTMSQRVDGAALEKILARVHPTPAVGVAPRTRANLEWLGQIRGMMGTPKRFGAPLGFFWEGVFDFGLMIRCLFWSGTELRLAAGAGIVPASEPDKEWAEMAMKRDWVKRSLTEAVPNSKEAVIS